MSDNHLLVATAELLIASLVADGFDTRPGDVDIICAQFRLIRLTSLDGAYEYFAEKLDALKRRILEARSRIDADVAISPSRGTAIASSGGNSVFAMSSCSAGGSAFAYSSSSGCFAMSSSPGSSLRRTDSSSDGLAQSLKEMGYPDHVISEVCKHDIKNVEDAVTFIFNHFGDNVIMSEVDNISDMTKLDRDKLIAEASQIFGACEIDVQIAASVNSDSWEGFTMAMLNIDRHACASCKTCALDLGSHECTQCKHIICSECVQRTAVCPFCRQRR